MEVIKALCGSGVKQLLLFGKPDCEALCELLISSHSLQQLIIHLNNLSSESVASIITGLSHNISLTDLDISNSHFSMANVESFNISTQRPLQVHTDKVVLARLPHQQ